MIHAHEDLLQELASFLERFSQLSAETADAAAMLKEFGAPPSPSFVGKLSESHTDFKTFSLKVVQKAHSLSLPGAPSVDGIDSLKELESLILQITEAEVQSAVNNEIRVQALMILDGVLGMAHRDNLSFAPLVECQNKARDLYRAISDAHWLDPTADAQALKSGEHPLAKLHLLVEHRDSLDDDRWTELVEEVEGALGKPMSVAVSRARIVFRNESDTHSTHHATSIGDG